MQTFALLLTVLAVTQVDPASGSVVPRAASVSNTVLPRSAIAPLRAALSTDDNALDGRLVLGSALVERSTVTVSYQNRDVVQPVITVVLGHPSQKPDGVRAGPFVILSRQGDDEAAVAALVTRLSGLGSDQFWQAAPQVAQEEPADSAEVVAPPEQTEASKRAKRLMTRADHALLVGDELTATAHLDTLAQEPELSADTLLDLTERFHRVKASDRVAATLERWKAQTINDITSPIASARAVVLGGGDISVLKVLQNARVSGNICGFEKLATSIDAMGKRVEALQFLDAAARKTTNCPDVAATMLEWLADDGRVSEATQLSEVLIQHTPNSTRVAAVRASMLLAGGQAQAAVDLLDPLVKRSPQSDLLGTYIHARLLLIDGEGDLEALAALSDAHIEDPLLALVAAAAHHREGKDEAAKRYLARTGDTYKAHPTAALLHVRLAFDRGDRTTASSLFRAVEDLDHDDPRAYIDTYALQAELLRWTDPAAAQAALKRAVLLGARESRGPDPGVRRLKAQAAALATCIDDGSDPPCPGPFLHPRDHDANTELEDADSPGNVFGNWMTILGVMLLFLVIVRQGRANKNRASRWN